MTYLMVGMLLAEEVNRGPDYGKASPVGLLIVVLLLLGVFALVRSMNRHLKRVPASFEPQPEAEPAAEPGDDTEGRPREPNG